MNCAASVAIVTTSASDETLAVDVDPGIVVTASAQACAQRRRARAVGKRCEADQAVAEKIPRRKAATRGFGFGISGTTGLFESCPLQRRLRDVRAVTQHYMLSARSAFGPVGTALLSEETAG